MKTILAVAIFATLAPAFAEAAVICKKSGEQAGAIKKVCYYNCAKWEGGLNQDVYEHCPRWVSRWRLNRNSQFGPSVATKSAGPSFRRRHGRKYHQPRADEV